jgi:SAM-dependent methyltransferase
VVIAEAAVWAGRQLAGDTVTGATGYWRARHWDRDDAEAAPVLGPEYAAERARISRLIAHAASPGMRALDVACGTGAFSAALLATEISSLQAFDVSPHAVRRARARLGTDDRLSLTVADFWTVQPDSADVIVCVDALHHIGMPIEVLERLKTFGKPGTVVIGNYWTGDNFHEFERTRHGALKHAGASIKFAGAAALARARGSSLSPLRTVLLRADESAAVLRSTFRELRHVHNSRYFLAFEAVI